MKETDSLLAERDVCRPEEGEEDFPSFRSLMKHGLVLDNTGSTARDHLANERTYLAWIRTALSLSGIGLALLKWQGIANAAGYLVFCLGVYALISSTVRYFRVMQLLSQNTFEPNVRTAFSVVTVILMVIIVLLCLHLTHQL